MKDFSGRTAVVTGAASGIGRALAFEFARQGMNVVLSDIEQRALAKAVDALSGEGYSVTGVVADVASAESVEALAAASRDAFGNVHVLCNNAGIAVSGGLVWEKTLADWEWSFRVNVWGVIHGIRSFVPGMLEHGEEGHIVNTASAAGLTPNVLGIYGVTKHAVVSLSEFLYRNLREVDAKLGASVLCPGYVNTEIGGSGRHRQAAYRNPRGVSFAIDPVFQERLRRRIENGLAPEQVAANVLEAIREERFWVLTDDEATDLVRSRADSILTQTNPEFSADLI